MRKEGEFADGHIKDAQWLTLQDLEKNINTLNKDTDYYIHCAGGYRSMVAASMLKKHGFLRVRNVYGGFGKIKETDIPIQHKKVSKKTATAN